VIHHGVKWLLLAPIAVGAVAAGAQRAVAAERSVEAADTTMLTRLVTVHVDHVSLRAAVTAIARAGHVQLQFRSETLDAVSAPVSLRANNMPLGQALEQALMGTRLEVIPIRSDLVSITPVSESGRVVLGGITGTVTDATTQKPIVGATISIDGTKYTVRAKDDGTFRIEGIVAGSYRITVRRIGYQSHTQVVTVTDDANTTVAIVLSVAATKLDQVVTTVTGDQRRVMLGNSISKINADSLVKSAPISSLSELLTGRVPGLQASQSQGTVGGSVRLQIRGQNSLNLSSAPIVIVDGIRYSSGNSTVDGPFGAEATSRLNDLNPNDIETVEVVKGPSAATLYGTDASNGVIVITTKRGRAGPARFGTYARGEVAEIAGQSFPDLVWAWSETNDVPRGYSCQLQYVAVGYCTRDSITTIVNPLNDARLSLFHPKPSWNYGGNVTGGSESLRYYVSADLENATGPVRLPAAIAGCHCGFVATRARD
jgi:TonB-dependent SusC/RagA subfamily outer membrane receptor